MSAARADAGAYDTFVGLEIHIQLDTRTKVFCGCPVAFGGDPNTRVCPICLGFPGVLPALNREAARMAYVVAQAVGCTLSTEAVFERKNYFYPDLPKNYQISQYGAPIGAGGSLTAPLSPTRPVAIREVDYRSRSVAALVLIVDPMDRVGLEPEFAQEVLGLTPTEAEIAIQLAQGRTPRQIAAATGREYSTVRTHLKHIFSKLGVSRQFEVAQIVFALSSLPKTPD